MGTRAAAAAGCGRQGPGACAGAIPTTDVHPLIVRRVRGFLETGFGIDEDGRLRWIRHWFDQGSDAIKAMLGPEGLASRHAHGDRVTLADFALVSHVIGARLFQADLARACRDSTEEVATMKRIQQEPSAAEWFFNSLSMKLLR